MSEIRRSPVEVGSLSRYLQGFLHPRWCGISSVNSMAIPNQIFRRQVHHSPWSPSYAVICTVSNRERKIQEKSITRVIQKMYSETCSSNWRGEINRNLWNPKKPEHWKKNMVHLSLTHLDFWYLVCLPKIKHLRCLKHYRYTVSGSFVKGELTSRYQGCPRVMHQIDGGIHEDVHIAKELANSNSIQSLHNKQNVHHTLWEE